MILMEGQEPFETPVDVCRQMGGALRDVLEKPMTIYLQITTKYNTDECRRRQAEEGVI